MNRIISILLAAVAALSLLSCVRELAPELDWGSSTIVGGHAITVSLPPETRTDFTGEKVVWAEGDSLWISNGATTESVVVPEEAWGQSEFSFSTKRVILSADHPSLYAVYPYSAAAGITDVGKLKVRIPDIQDGSFAHSNIAAAQAYGYSLQLVNLTTIMKVTVPSGTTVPVGSITYSTANNQALAGVGEIDLVCEDPRLSPIEPTSVVSIPVNGKPDTYYISVFPGTYDAGFRMTAVSTEPSYGYETRVTRVANTVRVNTMLNLGSIGANLEAPFQGDGTVSSPYLLENLGQLTSLALMVNGGITFAGKYLKVVNDIEGIAMPIGCFPEGGRSYPFRGNFDGGNHTLTLNINRIDQPDSNRLGFFGLLGAGANVHDVVIDGMVASKGDYIGGLAGHAEGDSSDQIFINNVSNSALISGRHSVGGVVGYAIRTQFSHCTNNGSVSASGPSSGVYTVSEGKLVFSGYYNRGTGGVVGTAISSNIDSCSNLSSISGVCHVGGIAGVSSFTNSSNCINIGSVLGLHSYYSVINLTDISMVGGVIGYAFNDSGLYDCENRGEVSAHGLVGGITGYIQRNFMSTSYNNCYLVRCVNNGSVIGTANGVGGVAGAACTVSGLGDVRIEDCVNNGEVVSTADAVGGIVGLSYDLNVGRNTHIKGCKNTASVTGAYYVGGVVGRGLPRVGQTTNQWVVSISNCENSGMIIGTCSDDKSLFSGGIVGVVGNGRRGSLKMYNCVNKGDVIYSVSSHTHPYVGGIVGRTLSGDVANIVNHGYVGPVGGDDNKAEGADARMGAIVGSHEGGDLSHAYFLEGSCSQALGLESPVGDPTNTIIGYDSYGVLSSPVLVNEQAASVLYQALNMWIGDQEGYKHWGWSNGPVFLNE